MKALEKYSNKSLVSNLTVGISMLLVGSVANSYVGKEAQSKFCLSMECRNLKPTDEIENAMLATAANIHLWSGNRSYKSILKAIIISSPENRVEKLIEINHHLLAMSLDVGNLRMARESVSIINRFAPESLTKLNQASLFNEKTPTLTMFERLNSSSKFSNREIDLINNNFQIKNNEYLIGNDSFNSESSELVGEEVLVDSIYNLTNSGTGEVFHYASNGKNRTNTLFSRLREKMSQLSYSKSDCRLRYMAQIREAVVVGALGGGAIGIKVGGGLLKVGGAIIGAAVGAAANGYNTSEKEKVELDKCNEGAEDSEKKTITEPPTTTEQQDEEQQSNEEDDKKRHPEASTTYESPNADLQESGDSSTGLVDLLSDYYNTINFRQIESYHNNTLTLDEVQLKISSIANFGNKDSGPGLNAVELAQQAIQKQEKWTTPVKPLKQSFR